MACLTRGSLVFSALLLPLTISNTMPSGLLPASSDWMRLSRPATLGWLNEIAISSIVTGKVLIIVLSCDRIIEIYISLAIARQYEFENINQAQYLWHSALLARPAGTSEHRVAGLLTSAWLPGCCGAKTAVTGLSAVFSTV